LGDDHKGLGRGEEENGKKGEREIKETSMLMKLMNSFNLQSDAFFKDSSLVYIGFSN
jgi:hypothetical protein